MELMICRELSTFASTFYFLHIPDLNHGGGNLRLAIKDKTTVNARVVD